MKKLTLILLSLALFSCTDTKKQEKDMLTSVIKIHDRVMVKDEQMIITKMQLDTLLRTNQDTSIHQTAIKQIKELDSADIKMENWMHNFNAENKGWSHDEIISYLTAQKKQIEAIEKHLDAAVTSSVLFIKQNTAR